MTASPPVLISVLGLSPGILTSSVWALAHETPSLIPEKIILLTTAPGRDKICQDLLTPHPAFHGKTVWEALIDELENEGIPIEGRLKFGDTSEHIRVFSSPPNASERIIRPLTDLSTAEENCAVADQILDTVRSYTSNPRCQVIASIAGGRKTMGALLYGCMSLLGRQTDRIIHVMVNSPFESPGLSPSFYFPNQPGKMLKDRDGAEIPVSNAIVTLAELPFVSVQSLFSKKFGENPGSFSNLVDQGINRLQSMNRKETPHISLLLAHKTIIIDLTQKVQLSPRCTVAISTLIQMVKTEEPVPESFEIAVNLCNAQITLLKQSAPENDWSDWRHDLKTFHSGQEISKAMSDLRSTITKFAPDTQVEEILPPGKFCLLMKSEKLEMK